MYAHAFSYRIPEPSLEQPDPVTFTGYVTFACPINEAMVEVEAEVVENDLLWETALVKYKGVEVSELMCGEQIADIETYFRKNREQIVRFDRDDY